MEKICTLEIENNSCVFLENDKKHCMAENTSCGFVISTERTIRAKEKEKKWFEKYYK